MPRDPRRVKVVPICHEKGCRSYVIVDPVSRDACVVDPLLDRVAETLRALSDEGGHLRWIVDTHTHGDHLSGAAALKERGDAQVVMHPEAVSDVATLRPADGGVLAFGEHGLKVHYAPGNAPDGLVLEAPGALFTGDTMLIGTVGLCDVPGTDAGAWFHTLHRIFDRMPEATFIHPGHDDMGRTQSTVKAQRTGNPWLRQDDIEAFETALAADDRPKRKDALELVEANRRGLTRVPRDLEAASGLVDPFHATEAALRQEPRWEGRPEAPPPALPESHRAIFLLTGTAAILGTLLGWGLGQPIFHALAGLTGVVLLGMGLSTGAARRRRRTSDAGLFYEGPARKGIG